MVKVMRAGGLDWGVDCRQAVRQAPAGIIRGRMVGDVDQIRDLSNGGVGFAVELAGTIRAVETAWWSIRCGGAVVTAGPSPAAADFSFNQGEPVVQEKSIPGSYMGSCVPVRDIPLFMDLYLQGRLPVDRLIDGRIGFDGINAGFDKLQDVATVRPDTRSPRGVMERCLGVTASRAARPAHLGSTGSRTNRPPPPGECRWRAAAMWAGGWVRHFPERTCGMSKGPPPSGSGRRPPGRAVPAMRIRSRVGRNGRNAVPRRNFPVGQARPDSKRIVRECLLAVSDPNVPHGSGGRILRCGNR